MRASSSLHRLNDTPARRGAGIPQWAGFVGRCVSSWASTRAALRSLLVRFPAAPEAPPAVRSHRGLGRRARASLPPTPRPALRAGTYRRDAHGAVAPSLLLQFEAGELTRRFPLVTALLIEIGALSVPEPHRERRHG